MKRCLQYYWHLRSQCGSSLLTTLGTLSVIGILVGMHDHLSKHSSETANRISAYVNQRGAHHLMWILQNDDLCNAFSANPNVSRVKLANRGDILKIIRTVHEDRTIRYYQLEQLTPIGELMFRDQHNNVTALTAVQLRAKTDGGNNDLTMPFYVTHDPDTNTITSCLERNSPRYMCLVAGRRWIGGTSSIQCD